MLIQKRHGTESYNLDTITEIICRLEAKDHRKRKTKRVRAAQKALKSASSPHHRTIRSSNDILSPSSPPITANLLRSRSEGMAAPSTPAGSVSSLASISPIPPITAISPMAPTPDHDHPSYAPSVTSQTSAGTDDSEFTVFVAHITVQQAQYLSVGDDIDYRREDGKFVGAKIIDKKGTELLICCQGIDGEVCTVQNALSGCHDL